MEFGRELLEYDQIEIDVKRIVNQCIKKIRVIIVCAVIGAILLPFVVYNKNLTEYQNSASELENELTRELTSEEENAIAHYSFIEKRVRQMLDYQESALVLGLDYENVYSGNLVCYVESENSDTVVQIIENYIKSPLFVQDLYEKTNMDRGFYVEDLITVVDTTQNAIILEIWANNEGDYLEYSNVLKEILEEYATEKCEVQILECNISNGFNEDVYLVQDSFYKDFNNRKATLSNSAKALTTAQKNVLNMELDINNISKPDFQMMYVIFGAGMGAVAGIILVVSFVLLGGKLQTDKEIQKRLNYIHLGTVGLDKDDEGYKEISRHIKSALETTNVQEISIFSTIDISDESKLGVLYRVLEENNIRYDVRENTLGENDGRGIIVVEKTGVSSVKKVYMQAEYLEGKKSKILGYICLAE